MYKKIALIIIKKVVTPRAQAYLIIAAIITFLNKSLQFLAKYKQIMHKLNKIIVKLKLFNKIIFLIIIILPYELLI